jgi:hypothetical protein
MDGTDELLGNQQEQDPLHEHLEDAQVLPLEFGMP